MIVSIHIPKTAGKSFRFRLEMALGPRLLKDYNDWIGLDTAEARAQRANQAEKMRGRRDQIERDYDVIYGQFMADKYVGVFPDVKLTAFFRDPCQQAASHYQFLLRHPELKHPWVQEFHRMRPSLPELIATVPNFQSMFLGSVALDDFAMVAVTEQYERGVALFGAVFGRPLPAETLRGNVNPDRSGDAYAVDPEVRRAIERHSPADIALYRKAREAFARLCARHDL